MTLQKRLVSEIEEKFGKLALGSKYLHITPEELDQIILHTIEQTIKEGCEVVAKLEYSENDADGNHSYDRARQNEGYEYAKTDTQHALRGIIR